MELIGAGLAANELEGLEGLAVGEVGAKELIAVEYLDDYFLGVSLAVGDVNLVVCAAVEHDGEFRSGLARRCWELDVEVLDVLVITHGAKGFLHEFVAALCGRVGAEGHHGDEGQE